MSKVVAIKGNHESCSSLLAQAMADDTIKNVVIVTFHENGESEIAHFKCTRMQLAFASLVTGQFALEQY